MTNYNSQEIERWFPCSSDFRHQYASINKIKIQSDFCNP